MPGPRSGQLHAVFAHYRKPRVLGLDLLRITASLSVIVYHGNALGALGNNWLGSIFGDDGFLAVDVFFVLSGWLLTRQVLRMRGAFTSTWRFATTFWIRRWLRTIPPYWVVLVGMFLLGPWLAHPGGLPHPFAPWYELTSGLNSPGDLLRHALFLQTSIEPNQFGVSWSLVTEEWFYLLLPFVILQASRIRNWRWLLGLSVAALLLPTAVRTVLLLTSSASHADDLVALTRFHWGGIKAQPIARFEGLVVGALLAAASVALPAWRTHVMPWRRWLFWLSCPVIIMLLLGGTSNAFWFRIFGLLAFSICVGLLIPYLSDLRWWASAPVIAVMGITFLSELTYPLYLVHTIVPRVPWAQVHGPMRLVYALLSLSILFGTATLLHLGIERPFLALRDRRAEHDPAGVLSARAPSWKEPAAGALSPPLPAPALVVSAAPPAGEGLKPALVK